MSIITSGIDLLCADLARSGGLKEIHLANIDDVTTFTLAGGLYTSVTMVGGKVFFKFEFERDTAEWRETVSKENRSVLVTEELEFFEPKPNQSRRDILQCIAESCGLIAIVTTFNGESWVIGFTEASGKDRPLELVTDTQLTGKALTDLNGTTIILGTTDKEKALTFTGTIPI